MAIYKIEIQIPMRTGTKHENKEADKKIWELIDEFKDIIYNREKYQLNYLVLEKDNKKYPISKKQLEQNLRKEKELLKASITQEINSLIALQKDLTDTLKELE